MKSIPVKSPSEVTSARIYAELLKLPKVDPKKIQAKVRLQECA